MLIMTRRMLFSAAVADWNPALSDEENEALFGPEASREPYGHNYQLDVGVEGEIDPKTGILVNIKEIDRIVKKKAAPLLDRKFINRQSSAFAKQQPTPENLARFIAEELKPELPDAVRLHRIRLETTPTSWTEWSAQPTANAAKNEERGMIFVTRQYEFSASHRLHSPHLSPEENWELFGKCNYENGHGHNYELEVTVTGPIQERSGRLLDARSLDAIVHHEVVDRYDHRHLNLDIPEFQDTVPSAEEIVRTIWRRLAPCIPAPIKLYKVLLRETPRNIFEYYGEEDPIR